MNSTMQAVVYKEYGPPDVLQLQEVTKPTPKDNEVLVRIHATTVSATDSHYRQADPSIIRFTNGLTRPKNIILGSALAGEVEAVGREVTLFKKGDQVVGSSNATFGTHAEYKCLPEDGVLTKIPAGLSFEEAVCIPEALTPLYFLRDLANVQGGQKVLINGASGALGTFAVQLAKQFGAEVTGVCSTANLELVKSLGADEVIDYTEEDFAQNEESYDVIFDAVGKSSFSDCKSALKEGGIYLTVNLSPAIISQMLWTSKFGHKKAMIGFAGLNQSKESLVYLIELAEAGELKTVVDSRYPIEKIAAAHRHVDSGRKKGNLVVTVARPW